MKLYFNTQGAANGRSTALHNYCRAQFPAYNASAAAGQTTAWSNTFQDLDASGQPINTFWYITCRDRCLNGLTNPEKARLYSEDQIGSP